VTLKLSNLQCMASPDFPRVTKRMPALDTLSMRSVRVQSLSTSCGRSRQSWTLFLKGVDKPSQSWRSHSSYSSTIKSSHISSRQVKNCTTRSKKIIIRRLLATVATISPDDRHNQPLVEILQVFVLTQNTTLLMTIIKKLRGIEDA
jgi:hypothetical protein